VSHGNGGDENTQLLGRLSERVWSDGPSNAQIGASASDLIYSGGVTNGGGGTIRLRDRPEIRVDGTRLIDTGAIAAKHGFMYAVDAGANFHNFFLGGEYAQFRVDRNAAGKLVNDHPDFSGWYLEGSWFVTGETRQYEASALNNEVGGWQGPTQIASPFSLSGNSWGAWELAARYSDTDLNWNKAFTGSPTAQPGITGGEEKIIDLAVNWYLNKNVRLMLNDLIVNVSRQSKAGIIGAGGVSNVGQNLNVAAARLQFAN
jgi:phosphate-selective porin OprO/OprP